MKKNYYQPTIVNFKKIILILLLAFLSSSGYSQFSEAFDNGIPATWSVFDNGVGTNQSWGITDIAVNVYSPLNSAEVLRGQIGQGNTSEDWLVTPQQIIPPNAQLRFFTRSQIPGQDSDNGITSYQIRISSTSQTDVSTFTTIQTYTENELSAMATQYEEKIINLAAYTGQSKYIAFVRVHTQQGTTVSGDRWLVDNVALVEKCPNPTVLHAVNITSTSATIGWTSSAPLFDIEYGPAGFTPGTGTIITNVSNPYTLTGLLPATAYQFCVKAKCSNGVEGECVGPFNFTTKPLGSVCNDPIVIGTLPYQVLTDNTGNYGDEVDTTQITLCGATPATTNYLAGDEVFYSFTATTTGPISITMTPQGTASTNSSLFVYQGCSSFPYTCLGGVANSGTAPRVVSLNVVAGTTYIIVISSSSATQTIGYSLLIQAENCAPKPTATTVGNFTQTTADLSWVSTYTTAEVAIQPLGSPVPTGAGIPVIGTSYTSTGLTAGTQYQYWVRGECAPGSGTFTAWAGPFPFNTTICNPFDACTHIFRMTDSANNGWDGARMEIRQNGIIVTIIGATYTSGAGPVDVPVQLCDGVPFDIYWTVAGTQPQQCIVSVINSFGQTLYTKAAGIGSAGNVLYTNTVNCATPLCSLAPTNTIATNIANYSATIGWAAPATTAWDVYIVPTGSPAPTVSTTPTYPNLTNNSLNVTGLIVDNSYDVYVRTVCSPLSSPWSAVYTFTTLATCPKPTVLTVPLATITQTEAVLGWTNGTPTDTQWEILLIKASPANNYGTPPPPASIPISSPGDILFAPVTTTSPFTPTGLEPATIYYYYIRTVCSTTDKSTWSGPIKFNTKTCADVDKCNYKFVLTDTGSNGWNGGRLQVRQNGIVVATLGSTVTGAGPTTISVALCNNVPFDLNWHIPGTAPAQIGLTIQNPFTDIIYTMVPGAITPPSGTPVVPVIVYSSTGNCTPPTCPKPTALLANVMTQTSAELSWTEIGTATQWEIYIAPTGAPAPVNVTPLGTAPPYYLATTNPFTITGLQPSTYYTYYVRAICSATDISTWTILNPKSFYTKPANDECAFATPIPVNPTKVCAMNIAGTTLGATATTPAPAPACSGYPDDDVWFSFVATNSVHIITLSNIVGSTPDLNHTLYSGTDCAALTQMYCSSPNVSVAANLTVGNTFLVRVYTNLAGATQSANFDICITTPPPVTNDECATATPAATNTGLACNVVTPGTLTGAMASADGGTTCMGTEDDDVWFSFVANSTTQYLSLINVLGTSTDLNHAVYSGVCGSLALKYCSAAGTLNSNNATFVVGETYYIRVWSNANVLQDITFNLCIGRILQPITVSTSGYTAQQMVTNVLMNNPCTAVSNVTSSTGTNFGSVNGIGSFDGSLSNFPFTDGIVLSTGNALSVPGPNMSISSEGSAAWPGDDELEAILAPAGMTLNSTNASKLEFDFVPLANQISFNFLFASEDYGTFQCGFSDAFAFILTDLTAATPPVNLAVVPGTTTPVSVLSIRNNAFNGACTSVNPQYFDVGYINPTPPGTNPLGAPINFNGLTVPMTASSAVISGHTYHIKIVIADHNDTAYDSAVFLQGGSFISGQPGCMDKIKLVAFVDGNANGIKDTNEGSFTYGSFVLQQNNTGSPTNISSPNGNYTFYDANPLNTYDFSYQINPEYANYYTATATNFNDINIPVGSGTQTLYFPITVTQTYNDVTVTIIPASQPRPGLTYVNKIEYKNLGITTTSGTLTFTKPALTTITYIGQTGTVINTTGFTYDFSNLAPNETRIFNVIMSVPTIPTVNIGDILTDSASITAPANDINLANNTFSNSQIVVGSYDPNDKMETHGEKILFSSFSANEYLTYTIRFQNTGTANAINVRLEDVLHSKLNPTSIRMVSASHNYVMTRVNNAVTWQFDDIQLPYATLNEALSNGYVTFQVKLLPGFALGDIVPNHADIYFDMNPAIITNTFNTEFVATLNTVTFNAENILIYPNPSSDIINIRLENTMENLESVVLYDMVGKSVLKSVNIDSNQSIIDVSALAKGLYLVEIITENKLKMTKKLLVK